MIKYSPSIHSIHLLLREQIKVVTPSNKFLYQRSYKSPRLIMKPRSPTRIWNSSALQCWGDSSPVPPVATYPEKSYDTGPPPSRQAGTVLGKRARESSSNTLGICVIHCKMSLKRPTEQKKERKAGVGVCGSETALNFPYTGRSIVRSARRNAPHRHGVKQREEDAISPFAIRCWGYTGGPGRADGATARAREEVRCWARLPRVTQHLLPDVRGGNGGG